MFETHLWRRSETFAFVVAWLISGVAQAQEPPALNPFGPVRTERDDAVPGYLEMSDGKVVVGNIYMTRDKRLKIYDASTKRQREIPLRVIKQIECKVLKEWMEKEWRFKELALDEKYYTGREYPSREVEYTITLHDDRTITGPPRRIVLCAALCLRCRRGKVLSSRRQTGEVPCSQATEGRSRNHSQGPDLREADQVRGRRLGRRQEEGRILQATPVEPEENLQVANHTCLTSRCNKATASPRWFGSLPLPLGWSRCSIGVLFVRSNRFSGRSFSRCGSWPFSPS